MTKLILVILCTVNLWAKTHYVDPQKGDIDNDGSIMTPWSTLQEVFDQSKIQSYRFKEKPAIWGSEMELKNASGSVVGGDTIVLLTGFHGKVYAPEYYNKDYITIMAAKGAMPKLESITFSSSSKWVIDGLTISSEFAKKYERQTLLNFESHSFTGPSRDIVAKNNTLYAVYDISAWSVEDWNTKPGNGIYLGGKNMTAENNYIKNINFGINAIGDSSIVRNNIVENFAGDGMRGLGNYSLFEYNIIKNSYDVNDNHDDGFQSWSVGDNGVGSGVVVGMILRGNKFINYEDPNQKFRGPLQGIGCFDGKFKDWVIENNIVMVDHWHGISIYGAENVRISNNTLVDLNESSPGPPWIKINDHKNGTKPINSFITNNLTTRISSSEEGVTIENNVIIDDYEDHFVDYANGDLHLKANSEAIGAGNANYVPLIDFEQNLRNPQRIDVGAYGFEIDLPTLNKKREAPQDVKKRGEFFSADGKKVKGYMENFKHLTLY